MRTIHKSFSRAFWTFILVSGLIIVSTINFGVVQASTGVTGIINSDTTWTKADSPYDLTGNVLVGNGATLTIEAGAAVNLSEYYIMVNGTLRAQGTETEQVQFNGGEITFTRYSSDWNEQTGSGSIIKYSTLDSTYVDIGYVSPKITNNSIWKIKVDGLANVSHNIILAGVTASGGMPTISNNNISGGLVSTSSSVISNNTISGDVDISGGSPTISYNTIFGEVDVSGGRGLSSAPVISNNIITTGGNTGIKCNGYAVISSNNISGCASAIGLYPVQILGGTSPAYPLIERNLLTNNTRGITVMLMSRFDPGTLTPTIKNNTIMHNSVGIYVYLDNYDTSPTIIYNNIYDNSDYNIQLDEETENDIDVAYNWWGTTDTTAINQTIYDFKYDFYLAKVNFVPFLTEPNPEAPSNVIPEFPSLIILPLLLTATFLIMLCRQRLPKTTNKPHIRRLITEDC